VLRPAHTQHQRGNLVPTPKYSVSREPCTGEQQGAGFEKRQRQTHELKHLMCVKRGAKVAQAATVNFLKVSS
jgi:hypothetical protein